MTGNSAPRHRAGYTLIEVALAAVVLGIIAVGIVRSISVSARATRVERERSVAMLLARNEIETLRAAGMAGAGVTGGDTARVNEAGEASADGRYTIIVERALQCVGGADPGDNALRPLTPACGGIRPLVSYTVRVRYPLRATIVAPGDSVGGELRYTTTLGGADRGAGARARPVTP